MLQNYSEVLEDDELQVRRKNEQIECVPRSYTLSSKISAALLQFVASLNCSVAVAINTLGQFASPNVLPASTGWLPSMPTVVRGHSLHTVASEMVRYSLSIVPVVSILAIVSPSRQRDPGKGKDQRQPGLFKEVAIAVARCARESLWMADSKYFFH
jgi:hypothetical protein